ncbi:MAG: hypothetical protein Q9191_003821, partial [Dirinaria sp. TL-2023a]
ILHVGDRVHHPALAHHKGVLAVQRRGHDARFVLAGFEMRVREAEEDARKLGFPEEVGQEFHRVAA